MICDLMINRLKQNDVKNNGFVLCGFPRTKLQARKLQAEGIIPSHFGCFFNISRFGCF